MQINKTVLQGRRVRLEPLAESHLPGLAAAIEDGRLWDIPVTIVPHPSDLASFLSNADAAFAAQRELAFATIDVQSSRIAGSTRFRCIDATHRRAEIGFTFLGASWQRTHINTEAKYLMLQHAFEVWGFNRVELLTDERNAKSRQAIERIGAKHEGILRSHMVMRDGFVRNSVVYSIIRSEWPEAKAALEAKLHAVGAGA
ncbi:MAG: GNAT family N-acetyltransferase [Burkholderiales bacterium]|nr:GNAT family N-acetyltransferase [Burkholderiales bacterium]